VIADRVAAVRERIARAAERAARSPADVTLVAVSKTHPPEAVREAFAAGVRDFGENRVQEAEPKIGGPPTSPGRAGTSWGTCSRTRRAGRRRCSTWSSPSTRSSSGSGSPGPGSSGGRAVRVLVQVDLAGEETKFGLPEAELLAALEALRGREGIRVEGLMVLPPFLDDPDAVRPFFRRLRALGERAAAAGLLAGRELSMGMSHDFEAAVEEGATIVRVGTAIFGERRPAA
jgi:PLP dependent protein